MLLLSIVLKAQATVELDHSTSSQSSGRTRRPMTIPFPSVQPSFLPRLIASSSCCDATTSAAISCCGESSPTSSTKNDSSLRGPSIDSLEDFPALLTRELAQFGDCKPRVIVFLDWDDTLTQREGTITAEGGGLYHFKYLFSPELSRQLQPTIDSVMGEMAENDPVKIGIMKSALEFFRQNHKYGAKIAYRTANSNLSDIIVQMRSLGVIVKICSGLSLDIDQERINILKGLGLEPADYIHAQDKASAMVRYIAETYCASAKPLALKGLEEVSAAPTQTIELVNYLSILVDNYLSEGPDFFYGRFEMAVAAARRTHGNIQITPRFVQDNRFTREIAEQRSQLKTEIGYTLQLYRPCLSKQINDFERRLDVLKQNEVHLAQLLETS